ncbi:unnamed protein product, partial [Mesorhabditis belari]|uniref:ZZ-type domain-containing protein n=1 Tax=Mesorhabditis belari TaxID=2138241 RepID=A0AAF3EC46_9BILA
MTTRYFGAGALKDYEDYHDATCEACQTAEIRGNRYDCHSCSITLCQNCYLTKDYGSAPQHNDFHTCKVTPCPLDRLASPQQNVSCNGCLSENFLAICYHCEVCDEFNLCESCHLEARYAPIENTIVKHESGHKMKEILPIEREDRSEFVVTACAIEFQQLMGSQMVAQPDTYYLNDQEGLHVLGQKSAFALFGPPKILFVEPNCRTYDDWIDFTKKNQFPEGQLICPERGVYTLDKNGRIELEQRKSADCKLTRQIVRSGDIVATVGAVGATTLGLVGLFTPLAPVAATTLAYSGAALTTWAVGRTGQQMYDRNSHEQTLNPLTDRDAFFCWFTLLSAAAPIGTQLAVNHLSLLAQEGAQISRTTQLLTNIAIFGGIGIGGFGLLSSTANLVSNLKKGRKPTPLEIFQLSAGLLFFSHSVANVKQASQIINDIHNKQTIDMVVPEKKDRLDIDDFTLLKEGNKEQNEHHQTLVKDGNLKGMTPPKVERYAEGIADRTRMSLYGGSNSDQASVTTILSMEPAELSRRIKRAIKPEQLNGRHNVELEGTYHAINQHFDPKTKAFRTEYVKIENPVFGLKNGEPIHLNAEASGRPQLLTRQQFYEHFPALNEMTPIRHIRFGPKFPKRRRKGNEEESDDFHQEL